MLENTLYKLTVCKKLKIVYFGGSITEGAGATDAERTSYRARTTAWLQSAYPEAEIAAYNAAIGGTGSDLGVCRCDRDVLSHDPDLVFFEFSVNDSDTDYFRVLSDSESILRKLLRHDPYTDIIMVFTTTAAISDRLKEGISYDSRTAHAALAWHYGLPQIDVGEALREAVLTSGGDFLKYTKDTVHPNDLGYGLYTDVICKRLAELLKRANLAPHDLPSPCSFVLSEGATLVDAFEAESVEGFSREESPLCGRYPHYLFSDKAGASLSFSFFGKGIGLYWMLAEDGGDIEYRIDGGAVQSARAFDEYCLRFRRAHYSFLGGDLPEGKHTLSLTVTGRGAEESTGSAIRIGAFLIR